MTPAQAQEILAAVRANAARLEACAGPHDFSVDAEPARRIGKRWRCTRCGGEVDSSAKGWYAAGLRHGGRSG